MYSCYIWQEFLLYWIIFCTKRRMKNRQLSYNKFLSPAGGRRIPELIGSESYCPQDRKRMLHTEVHTRVLNSPQNSRIHSAQQQNASMTISIQTRMCPPGLFWHKTSRGGVAHSKYSKPLNAPVKSRKNGTGFIGASHVSSD